MKPVGTWTVVPSATEEPLFIGTAFAGEAVVPEMGFRIANANSSMVSISNISFSSADFEIVGAAPTSVAANSTVEFSVRMKTLTIGSKTCTVTVATSAGTRTVKIEGDVK